MKKEDLNSFSNFKEEMINSLCQIEEKTENKISLFDSYLHNQIESFQTKITEFQSTINSLLEKTTRLEIQTNSMTNSMPQIKSLSENVLTSDIKITNLEKEFEKMCIRYEKIFNKNLKVQGIIGEYCKYKTLKDYISANVLDLNNLKTFKDKVTYDIKGFNENILTLQSKVESIKIINGNFINERLKLVEKDYEEKINQYLDKMMEVKIENAKYYQEIILNIEKINKDMEELANLKIALKKQYDDYINKMEKDNKKIYDDFEDMKNNFQKIKHQFKNLYEFIKDVRFKKNINKDVTKNEIQNILNNIENPSNEKNVNSDIKNILYEKKNNNESVIEITNLKLKDANNFLGSASNTTILQINTITTNSINSNSKEQNKLPNIDNHKSINIKSRSLNKLTDKQTKSSHKRYSLDGKKNSTKLNLKVGSKKKKIIKV
jgi:hypothetical protein